MEANRIAAAIRRHGLTHAQIAQALGISRVAVSDRMRGKTRWQLTEAAIIARVLGMDLDDLVSIEDDLELGYALIERAAS